MEREQKPIITVGEFPVDFVFHVVGLAAELRAHINDLLESIEWSPQRDLAGFGSHSHGWEIFTPGNCRLKVKRIASTCPHWSRDHTFWRSVQGLAGGSAPRKLQQGSITQKLAEDESLYETRNLSWKFS